MGTIAEEQKLRKAKACEGLEDGSMVISNHGPSSWIVQNGDHTPHLVKWVDGVWSCDCFDFQHKGNTLRCKHIEAVIIRLNHLEQSKENQMETNETNHEQLIGYVEVFHPAGGGVLCKVPVPVDSSLSEEQIKTFFNNVSQLIKAGFNGKELGEQRKRVTQIARRSRKNQLDGSTTSIIDVYTGGMFKSVFAYLNTPEEVKEFESVFGLDLKKIPVYEGDNAIQIGKDPDKDQKYVIPVNKPVFVLFKNNPKYEGSGDNKNTKMLFVGWSLEASDDSDQSVEKATSPTPSNKQKPALTPPEFRKAVDMGGFGANNRQRKYLDGTLCSTNTYEIAAFDTYVNENGKPPHSVDQLRMAYTKQA
jgi:hypothetical protein